jgi:hypothetical protein
MNFFEWFLYGGQGGRTLYRPRRRPLKTARSWAIHGTKKLYVVVVFKTGVHLKHNKNRRMWTLWRKILDKVEYIGKMLEGRTRGHGQKKGD